MTNLSDVSFDYRPQAGVHSTWVMWIDDAEHFAELDRLSDVESEIEDVVDEHAEQTQSSIVRVQGAHGWRRFEMSNGEELDFRWEHAPIDFRCTGCGYDASGEGYMVHDEVWAKAGFTDGCFCIGCLEAALGRRVSTPDFQDLPMNTDPYRVRSKRLRDRLGALIETEPERPKVTLDAPVGSADFEAFDDEGNSFEITPCRECLPWRAEVVRDVEDDRPIVREWHAAECPHLAWLLDEQDTV
ncbi:hypothetical protein ACWCPQ_26870 [Nocardia sp. NPDC001965]